MPSCPFFSLHIWFFSCHDIDVQAPEQEPRETHLRALHLCHWHKQHPTCIWCCQVCAGGLKDCILQLEYYLPIILAFWSYFLPFCNWAYYWPSFLPKTRLPPWTPVTSSSRSKWRKSVLARTACNRCVIIVNDTMDLCVRVWVWVWYSMRSRACLSIASVRSCRVFPFSTRVSPLSLSLCFSLSLHLPSLLLAIVVGQPQWPSKIIWNHPSTRSTLFKHAFALYDEFLREIISMLYCFFIVVRDETQRIIGRHTTVEAARKPKASGSLFLSLSTHSYLSLAITTSNFLNSFLTGLMSQWLPALHQHTARKQEQRKWLGEATAGSWRVRQTSLLDSHPAYVGQTHWDDIGKGRWHE